MITMFDSVDVSQLPSGPYSYAGYVNGHWPTYAAVKAKFPNASVLSIAVSANADAECLDVERGDAVNADAPGWVKRQQGGGIQLPTLYTSVSNMDALLHVLIQSGISRNSVSLWSAHYGSGEHICGPGTCRLTSTLMDGTQWNNRAMGRNLDQSTFFGRPVTPDKVITTQIGEIKIAQQVDVICHVRSGVGYVDVQVPYDKVIGAPSLNSSDPGPGGSGYPPAIVLSKCNVGGVCRVVATAVNTALSDDIGVRVTVSD